MGRVGFDIEQLERRLEIPVIIAALATIPLTLAQTRGLEGGLVAVGDWVVWAIFTVEYAVMVSFVPDRWAYTRRSWLSVAIIVLTFPLLHELLAFLRLLRLARLTRVFRLVRLVGVTARGLRALRTALGHRGLVYMVAVSVVLVIGGGATLAVLEPDTVPGGFWTGVWWGVVTATTVGYGDVAPVTLGGRAVAVALMIAGVGLVATVAASVAAYFVGKDEEDAISEVRDRLDQMAETLKDIQRRLD